MDTDTKVSDCANKYDIKNLITNKEYRKLNHTEVKKITGVTDSTLSGRINHKRTYGMVFNNWILKQSCNLEYAPVKSEPSRYVYTMISDNANIFKCMSWRTVAKKIHVTKRELNSMLHNGNSVNGWSVSCCSIDNKEIITHA